MKDLTIATADTGTIETSVNATGKVSPAIEEIINSPISTTIMEIYCHAGDSVTKGTPLLRLDLQNAETELSRLSDQIKIKQSELSQQAASNHTRLSNLSMQIRVKEMELDRLKAEVANEKYLDSIGSGTGDRVMQAQLAYDTGVLELENLRTRLANERKETEANRLSKNLEVSIAGRNLDEMRRTLSDAQILSPRKGTLTFILNEVGGKISEGERIAIVSDLDHFKVEGEIADTYADRIAIGNPVTVKIGKTHLSGKISGITPQSSGGTVPFIVTLDDDANQRLRSGQKTDIYVMTDIIEDAIRVPNGSFYTGPGEKEMFVLSGDNTLERRKVIFGESSYDYVEVKSGLKPDEKIVTNDMKEYINHKKIKIKQ